MTWYRSSDHTTGGRAFLRVMAEAASCHQSFAVLSEFGFATSIPSEPCVGSHP